MKLSYNLPQQQAENDYVPWAARHSMTVAALAVAALLLFGAWLLTL